MVAETHVRKETHRDSTKRVGGVHIFYQGSKKKKNNNPLLLFLSLGKEEKSMELSLIQRIIISKWTRLSLGITLRQTQGEALIKMTKLLSVIK